MKDNGRNHGRAAALIRSRDNIVSADGITLLILTTFAHRRVNRRTFSRLIRIFTALLSPAAVLFRRLLLAGEVIIGPVLQYTLMAARGDGTGKHGGVLLQRRGNFPRLDEKNSDHIGLLIDTMAKQPANQRYRPQAG